MVGTIWNLSFKNSGFCMFPDFEWSDFRCPLYCKELSRVYCTTTNYYKTILFSKCLVNDKITIYSCSWAMAITEIYNHYQDIFYTLQVPPDIELPIITPPPLIPPALLPPQPPPKSTPLSSPEFLITKILPLKTVDTCFMLFKFCHSNLNSQMLVSNFTILLYI